MNYEPAPQLSVMDSNTEKLIDFVKEKGGQNLARLLDELLATKVEILHYDSGIDGPEFAEQYQTTRQLLKLIAPIK